jgi:hypothetical protein
MDALDEANRAKAKKLLQPVWSEVVELLGPEPTSSPYYRTLVQAVAVQGRTPRNVLDDLQYLRR